MSTAATADPIPATPEVPTETSLAEKLYGPTKDVPAEPSEPATPEPTKDTEPAPAEKPDASPPSPAKPEEPPKAPEEKEKDPVKEQLAQQEKANKRLGRENAELRQKFEQLMQKHEELIARANGEEPPKKPQPTEDQIRAQENFRGRDLASKPVAYQMFGQDEVISQVYGKEEGEVTPFMELAQAKPWVYFEVTKHDQPAVAAMQALKREAFVKKFGDDPTKWEEKIIAAVKPKLFEEFQKQLTTPPVGNPVPTVTEARNAGGSTHTREKSLAELLYGGK